MLTIGEYSPPDDTPRRTAFLPDLSSSQWRALFRRGSFARASNARFEQSSSTDQLLVAGKLFRTLMISYRLLRMELARSE